ncbi:hypothetical protein JCM19055_1150 [Geomicrobium sp. JCM 19055]|nr:hypothetical protein JCM19055_1150 [Geomicrobium sp. JCM 19055]
MEQLKPYQTETYFDEMFTSEGKVKPHYRTLHNTIRSFDREELKLKHEQAQASFLRQGITFTLYQDNLSTERTMPFDFIPIIISSEDWVEIERGIEQRIKGLNAFLEDIYGEERIIKEGIIPEYLIKDNPYYIEHLKGFPFPLTNHIFLAGIDLIRDDRGEYRVLEDNLRNPSGLSYMYQNRFVMRHVYPEFFKEHTLYKIEQQLDPLRQTLMDYSSRKKSAVAVLLTPGVFNSAYYDHVFLAQQMGIQLVEGSDLVVKGESVYMRTIHGLRQVDVIYRRIDDDYLDPEQFRSDSLLGVKGLYRAASAGNVAIVNAMGNGVADDKALYAFVPDIIRYYLNEEPILKNVDTYSLRKPSMRKWVLERLDQLVIKNVGSSGGYDMLIGPHSTREKLNLFREKIIENPEQYIAQPTIKLSRAPAFQDNQFYPCHVDLRVYAMSGKKVRVIPGGLSRVALKKGSLVVNSSQGGGGKDTWVLKKGVRV